MTKIGLPRALLYYQQYPMWRTFLEELGAETVISPATTRGILAGGSQRVVSETCLPTKIFVGHCVALGNDVDFVFVPSVKSIEPNVYNCSKFVGLPDLVQAGREGWRSTHRHRHRREPGNAQGYETRFTGSASTSPGCPGRSTRPWIGRSRRTGSTRRSCAPA